MAHTIVIVGGLGDSTDRNGLLAELRSHAPDIEWDWVKPVTAEFYLPPKPFRRLLSQLRDSTADPRTVVKLNRLHGRDQGQLYGVCPDPVLVPRDIDSSEAFLAWLFSREANVIPHTEWHANAEEAAIIAILAKLIRNKSWNKDTRGHQWTKENDLLGQAPVLRNEFPEIAKKAASMLPALKGPLLLAKGGSQGKTPSEWSIKITSLLAVKKCIVEQSFAPLQSIGGLGSTVERVMRDADRCYRLDDVVVTERVRRTCVDVRENP